MRPRLPIALSLPKIRKTVSVRWVERSETHYAALRSKGDGFRFAIAILRAIAFDRVAPDRFCSTILVPSSSLIASSIPKCLEKRNNFAKYRFLRTHNVQLLKTSRLYGGQGSKFVKDGPTWKIGFPYDVIVFYSFI